MRRVKTGTDGNEGLVGASKEISGPWIALIARRLWPWGEVVQELWVVRNTQESKQGRNSKSRNSGRGDYTL